jgi:hypothetical protein
MALGLLGFDGILKSSSSTIEVGVPARSHFLMIASWTSIFA